MSSTKFAILVDTQAFKVFDKLYEIKPITPRVIENHATHLLDSTSCGYTFNTNLTGYAPISATFVAEENSELSLFIHA